MIEIIGSAVVPISRGDLLKVLCHVAGMYEEDQFVRRIKRVPLPPFEEESPTSAKKAKKKKGQPIQKTLERNIRERRRFWFEGHVPNDDSLTVLLEALRQKWPKGVPDPENLLQEPGSVPDFLEKCRVKYSHVKDRLTEESQNEWENRHYRLAFMKTLNEYADDPKANQFLSRLIGSYRLYRKHSVVPGILRENFIIKEHAYGHCEGTYIQYKRGSTRANLIPFNVFYCGFYVMAFGAHKARGERSGDADRTEIITVSVLIQNAYAADNLLDCKGDNRYFVGLLSGIYDDSNVLLSERVLIEKWAETPETNLTKMDIAPLHIRSESGAYRNEYNKVIDVIDNSLDGQTLTSRPNRREWVIPDH